MVGTYVLVSLSGPYCTSRVSAGLDWEVSVLPHGSMREAAQASPGVSLAAITFLVLICYLYSKLF